MKTVQDLINEERERQNPKYKYISVNRIYGSGVERFFNPSNIKCDGEWLEFDYDYGKELGKITDKEHIKMIGRIVEYVEKLK